MIGGEEDEEEEEKEEDEDEDEEDGRAGLSQFLVGVHDRPVINRPLLPALQLQDEHVLPQRGDQGRFPQSEAIRAVSRNPRRSGPFPTIRGG